MSGQHSTTQIVLFALSVLLRLWGVYGLPIARWLVQTWVRAYTHLTTSEARADRRLEIASDVADHIAALRAEGYHPSQIGARVLFRALGGVVADVDWTCRHLSWVDRLIYSNFFYRALYAATMVGEATAHRFIPGYGGTERRHHETRVAKWIQGTFMYLFVTVVIVALNNRTEKARRLDAYFRRQEATVRSELVCTQEILSDGVFWPEHRLELERHAAGLTRYLQTLQKARAQIRATIRPRPAAAN